MHLGVFNESFATIINVFQGIILIYIKYQCLHTRSEIACKDSYIYVSLIKDSDTLELLIFIRRYIYIYFLICQCTCCLFVGVWCCLFEGVWYYLFVGVLYCLSVGVWYCLSVSVWYRLSVGVWCCLFVGVCYCLCRRMMINLKVKFVFRHNTCFDNNILTYMKELT